MSRMIVLRLGVLFALLAALAACGDAGSPAAGSAPTGAPAATRASAPPTAALPATSPPAPTAAVPATSPPAPTAAQAAATSPAPSAQPSGEAIAQGLTPEGYHFLGRADAPVTFQDFSDFL